MPETQVAQQDIQSVLREARKFDPPAEFSQHARIKSMAEYQKLYDASAADPEKFWAGVAGELHWFQKWDKVLEWDLPWAKWFVGGKINLSYNCLDRHVQTARKDKTAILWEGEPGEVRTFTYQQLLREVSKCANALKAMGIKPGDRVAIYMGMTPELAIALLACARIGAVHSVIFGGFSANALVDRINDAQCIAVITQDSGYRRGNEIKLKATVDEALQSCPSVKHRLVSRCPGSPVELQNGATVLLYEGAPNHPDFDRFWQMIDRHKVTIFYTAPTAIRAFIKWGSEYPKRHKLDSLRLLGTVGEPINPEAWMWYRDMIGKNRCPIVDTWWQTETGMIMISPLPGAVPTKPGSATVPLPGVFPDVVTRAGESVPKGSGGLLVLRKPWPAMARTIFNDPDRFVKQYWSDIPGMYFTGDGARKDEDGYYC